MTSKDYKLIADVLALHVGCALIPHRDTSSTAEQCKAADVEFETTKSIAHYLAGAFARDNPNFDRREFIRACGLED